MDKKGANLIEALDRVEEFLTLNASQMGEALTPTAREKFAAMRERMVAHMKAQDGTGRVVRSRTAIKQQLRIALVDDHLRPIAMMARSELSLSPTPTAFTLPHRHARYTDVIAAGYGLAEAAGPHRAELVAGGLRENFIEQLVAATDALRDAVSAKSQVVALRVEATALLRKQGRGARRYLRALDSVVRSAIKPDQELFDRWANLSRVVSAAAAAEEEEVVVQEIPIVAPAEGRGDRVPERVAA